MSLADELKSLLELANGALPTAAALRAHFEPRARAVSVAGDQLARPAWADTVGGADDVFVELGADAIGVRLWDDPRGWGTYAELAVARGTLADLEPVTGPFATMPRLTGGERFPKVAAYVQRGGCKVRVFASHDGGAVKQLLVHFEAAA